MKFKKDLDKQIYKNLNISEEVIRKRLGIAKKATYLSKNKKKSKNMKDRWRRDNYKLKKAIKKWHRSTDGKRFHRALGKFNALRESPIIYYYNKNEKKDIQVNYDFIVDALINLSSIETHLYLELQYYEPDIEALFEYIELVISFVEDSEEIKEELLDAFYTGKLNSEIYKELIDIFQFFMDPKFYLYSKREQLGLSNDMNIDSTVKEDLQILEEYKLNNNKLGIFEYIRNKYESDGSSSDFGNIPSTKLDVIEPKNKKDKEKSDEENNRSS